MKRSPTVPISSRLPFPQKSLRKNKAQIARSCIEGWSNKRFCHTAGGRTAASYQITKPLHNDTTTQHITQASNRLTIAVRIFERLREMLGNQQSKVGVIRLLFGVFVAMTVDGNNSIRVFIYYCTLGVHTEGADLITVFFGSIYYHNLVE